MKQGKGFVKAFAVVFAAVMTLGMAACGGSQSSGETAAPETEAASESAAASEEEADTTIQVFIAASLSNVMEDVKDKFQETHPNVEIIYTADSSGTLKEQILNGFSCDIFFSAAQKQMNELEEKGFLVEGSRANVVNNQLVVITYKDSGTQVTGLQDLDKAASIALADGSVPVGRYTRLALISLGILSDDKEAADITTQEVSDALGGVTISEQGNVSKVLLAVAEHSCEVGTTYYSDTYGHEDDVEILETVSYDVSGNIIYPVAQIVNEEADEAETAAAREFTDFITSEEAKQIFDSYYFDTNVE
jgi:molybdate transport system substrate-binding protein